MVCAEKTLNRTQPARVPFATYYLLFKGNVSSWLPFLTVILS
jgi:hypothetical protein